MSVVALSRYRGGEPAPGGGEAARALLAPCIVSEGPDEDFVRVRYGDGEAELYLGAEAGAEHVVGLDAWGLVVEAARAADWVIRPAGGAALLTDEDQRAELPADERAAAVLVRTGADLVRVLSAGE